MERLVRWTLIALATAVVLALGGAGGAAGAAGEPTPLVAPAGFAGSYQVTLITGDRVRLDVGPDGGQTAAVEPADRGVDATELVFDIFREAGDLYVIPSDAAPYVGDRLDRQLFNVTRLVAQGLDDGRSSTLPVIVDYEHEIGALPPALSGGLVLESIDAVAAREAKPQARAFGRALAQQASRDGAGARASAAEAGLFSGIEKIWLDATIEVALDESVPQIGAPAAWAAGYDGTGVTVAVIDTGIDRTHPDLAGKIAASRSFVPGEEVADGHGHGTHVAATIAGSGAASGGRFKGVAPGATLVVGKVLSNAGTGPISQVVDGIEWAALEQDADVVNLSLGSEVPLDASDPASQAIDNLTASTGTLFVVAAGNLGPGSYTIAAPGAAAAALTVGAVNKAGALGGFSSRGPSLGDHRLKPEISAPGVSITAARAAGTSIGTPVDASYTIASGTSMATPHVAGAAAILSQRHPDWAAPRLKAALVATSEDGGHTVYQQGAGRVDVARAVRQELEVSPATADFGFFPWPQAGPPVTRTLTYANSGDAGLTLDLTLTAASTAGTAVSAAALALAADSVTVPAGGTASVALTLDPTAVEPGRLYTGKVVAAAPDGSRLATPVGFVIDEQHHAVDVTVLDRTLVSDYVVVNVSLYAVDGTLAGESRGRSCLSGCTWPVEFVLPAGTYSARAWVRWTNASGEREFAVLLDPEVEVGADTDIVLDANDATEIGFDTHRPSEPLAASSFSTFQTTADGSRQLISLLVGSGLHWSVTPTEPVTTGRFWIASHWLLAGPGEGMPPYVYQVKVYEDGRVPESLRYAFAADEVATVDNRFHADAPGTPLRLGYFTRRAGEFAVAGLTLNFQGPATLREYVAPLRADAVHERRLTTTPGTLFPLDNSLDVFADPGGRVIRWNARPTAPGGVNHPEGFRTPREDLNIVPFPFWVCAACRQGDTFTPFMHLVSAEPQHARGRLGTPFGGDRFRLFRDGVELPQGTPIIGAFTTYELPPEPSRYRLTLAHGTSETAWEFGSATVTEDATPPGFWCPAAFPGFGGSTVPCRAEPLIFLRYDAGTALDNTVPTPGGHHLWITAYRQAPPGTVPPLAGLRLWISTDDGRSWQAVPATHRGGGRHRATVYTPVLAATTGRVSIRVEAWDAAGNRVEQTILGAYGLSARTP